MGEPLAAWIKPGAPSASQLSRKLTAAMGEHSTDLYSGLHRQWESPWPDRLARPGAPSTNPEAQVGLAASRSIAQPPASDCAAVIAITKCPLSCRAVNRFTAATRQTVVQAGGPRCLDGEDYAQHQQHFP